ncbi:Rhomboid family [Burkholderiales bacterium JOSHI_001]|nr:Rhomboid family [Burkholderiales bacterium JOSHI_001]
MERSVRLNAWLALAALLAAGALVASALPRQALDWQPQLALSQPWRLITAAWVHWSPLHLLANVLGCAAVAAWGWRAHCDRHDALAWAAAWPLSHLVLLAQPQLLHYGGLSGVLHAGVVVAAVRLLFDGPAWPRAIALAVIGGLGLKVVLEAPWQGPLRQVPGWDIAIAPLAHIGGAAAGLLCALLLHGVLLPMRRHPPRA